MLQALYFMPFDHPTKKSLKQAPMCDCACAHVCVLVSLCISILCLCVCVCACVCTWCVCVRAWCAHVMASLKTLEISTSPLLLYTNTPPIIFNTRTPAMWTHKFNQSPCVLLNYCTCSKSIQRSSRLAISIEHINFIHVLWRFHNFIRLLALLYPT